MRIIYSGIGQVACGLTMLLLLLLVMVLTLMLMLECALMVLPADAADTVADADDADYVIGADSAMGVVIIFHGSGAVFDHFCTRQACFEQGPAGVLGISGLGKSLQHGLATWTGHV